MLLPKQTLSEAARKQYALFTNPFDGEVISDAQMFINGEIRFVHETAWQAAVGGRMVAVIGESGAGKTTMLDDLKEKIVREHRPVVCIEPSVEGMEETDTKGRGRYTGIFADGIEAIVQTLADFPEARSVSALFIRRAAA